MRRMHWILKTDMVCHMGMVFLTMGMLVAYMMGWSNMTIVQVFLPYVSYVATMLMVGMAIVAVPVWRRSVYETLIPTVEISISMK